MTEHLSPSSDSVDERIKFLDSALRAQKLDHEVWLRSQPLSKELLDDDRVIVHQLGLCKFDGQWQLGVREVTFDLYGLDPVYVDLDAIVRGLDPDSPDLADDLPGQPKTPTRLVDASLPIRRAALQALPALADLLGNYCPTCGASLKVPELLLPGL